MIARLRAAICALAAVVGLLGVRDAGSAQTLAPLHVIVLPLEVAAAAYYAKEMNFFARAGLDVTIESMANGNAISAAVISGSADIGVSNPISVEIAHEKGLPVTILAGSAWQDAKAPTQGLLTVVNASPIHSAKDLNGKIVAVNGIGGIPDLGVKNWVDKNGGDSSTVKFVELPFPSMPAALIAGRIDAASMGVRDFNNTPAGQVRVLGNSFDSFGPRWLQSVWFTSKDFAAKHPDLAKKFIVAIRAASAWANAHPREAVAIFSKYYRSYDLNELMAEPRPPLVTQPVTAEQLQTTIDIAVKYGDLKAGFPGSELISPLNSER